MKWRIDKRYTVIPAIIAVTALAGFALRSIEPQGERDRCLAASRYGYLALIGECIAMQVNDGEQLAAGRIEHAGGDGDRLAHDRRRADSAGIEQRQLWLAGHIG